MVIFFDVYPISQFNFVELFYNVDIISDWDTRML